MLIAQSNAIRQGNLLSLQPKQNERNSRLVRALSQNVGRQA